MNESATRGGVTHRREGLAHPLVTEIITALALFARPMEPGIVVPTAEYERFKFNRSFCAEQWKLELWRSVIFFEQEAKGMFGRFERLPIPPALDSETTVNSESGFALWVKHFDRNWSFPRDAVGHRVEIDAGLCIEQIAESCNY